jgi:2-amino-4-hydroxy-6-hydroxymethyldihydropteridine diphosphokinase
MKLKDKRNVRHCECAARSNPNPNGLLREYPRNDGWLTAFIALGSNLDNPHQQVLLAMEKINNIPTCRVIKRSSLYETAPVGYIDQPNFINAVIKIETELSPLDLLHALQQIEMDQGRIRTIKNGPRTIDCDLILYSNINLESEELILPHPRMLERDFVLQPLAEIEPSWRET